jgi:hypothetical protein
MAPGVTALLQKLCRNPTIIALTLLFAATGVA